MFRSIFMICLERILSNLIVFCADPLLGLTTRERASARVLGPLPLTVRSYRGQTVLTLCPQAAFSE